MSWVPPRRVTSTPTSIVVQETTPTIAVGELVSDGVPTPEQISLWLPVTGTVSQSATATCQYKLSSHSEWTPGHPLYRVRPDFQTVNFPIYGGPILDGFAWVIIDLVPGQTYDVEVTVTEGTNQVTKSLLNHTTRALPGPAQATGSGQFKYVSGGVTNIQTQLDGLNPGDVLEIAAGTYTLPAGITSLIVRNSGTPENPIYIRGASRTGTIIYRPTADKPAAGIWRINASYIIFENMTVIGDGVVGWSPSSYTTAFECFNTSMYQTYVTVRNVTASSIDRFVDFWGRSNLGNYSEGDLVYDNTATGPMQWTDAGDIAWLNQGRSWNMTGIIIPGKGNCAFNNTLTGFGDAFSYGHHFSGAYCDGTAIHYYRNDLRRIGDDVLEADHGRRNLTFYDNRVHNSQNLDSFDPLYAGPTIIARNICINLRRIRIHKWQSTQCGYFLFNNTFLWGPCEDNPFFSGTQYYFHDNAGWYHPENNNAPQKSIGFQNNLHVYRGAGGGSGGPWMLRLDCAGMNPMDWTHNSWYPNFKFKMRGNDSSNLTVYEGTSLQNLQSIYPAGTPVFSGLPRLTNDNITVSNPWVTTITLPSPNADTEYTGTVEYLDLVISDGDAAKHSGVHIPNITDGYSGGAPDRGAVIEGRSGPAYGDRSTTGTALSIAAAAVPSNTFVQFHGNDLNKKTIHPLAGISPRIGSSATVPDIDVTEDGASSANPAMDWASHGVYDSIGKRVMWASQGQGGNGASGMYARNTHAIYSEMDSTYGMNQGRWFANRAFIAPGGNDLGLGHQYGGNAIDVAGRRFYRTSFNENRVWVCDLDSLEWIDSFVGAPQVSYLLNGALEFIPTRGTVGALWCWGSNFGHHIWEKVLPNGSWVQIVSGVSTSPDEGCPMAYNPRSNKVLCGTENQAAYIVDCATLAVTATATPTFTPNFMYPANGHLCTDPSGTGWVYLAADKHVYKCSVNGVWTDAGLSPILYNATICVALEGYGVIWYVGATYPFGNEVSVVNPQAWLYKP